LQALLGVLVVAIGYPLHWRRHRVKGGELQAAIND